MEPPHVAGNSESQTTAGFSFTAPLRVPGQVSRGSHSRFSGNSATADLAIRVGHVLATQLMSHGIQFGACNSHGFGIVLLLPHSLLPGRIQPVVWETELRQADKKHGPTDRNRCDRRGRGIVARLL